MAHELLEGQTHAAEGKYLTFMLDGGHYGIPILHVREIIAVQPITPLPRMPESVRGVVNLRGKIIPIIDLRTALGLHAEANDRSTCVIVLEVDLGDHVPASIGCVVNAVTEVSDISAEELQPPPAIAGKSELDSIRALAKAEESDHVVSLLDMEPILSGLFHSSELQAAKFEAGAAVE
ncbi:MAG: purine-binding chemotaxis protein CheW [Actinomycetales bacterium]|nr:purine-binding chemotaxis protein CheW [Actinomycetales bacterium]